MHACLAAASCCAWPESRAAGGHFAVDDAALLDAGQCQLDTWGEREPGTRTLVHAGVACRIGPVELGLGADRQRLSGARPATVAVQQVKWAQAIDERTSIGVVALAGWRGRSPRYAGAALYAPVTVRVAEGVWLHANAGRDWMADAPATSRLGIAVEWQAATAWSLTGEALRQSGTNIARAGVRWQPSATFNVDLSRAEGGAGVGSSWSLGATWTF